LKRGSTPKLHGAISQKAFVLSLLIGGLVGLPTWGIDQHYKAPSTDNRHGQRKRQNQIRKEIKEDGMQEATCSSFPYIPHILALVTALRGRSTNETESCIFYSDERQTPFTAPGVLQTAPSRRIYLYTCNTRTATSEHIPLHSPHG
jgi:hypothetical protein